MYEYTEETIIKIDQNTKALKGNGISKKKAKKKKVNR